MSREMNIIENVVNVIQTCHRKNIPVFLTQQQETEESSGILYSWWKNPIIKGSERWRRRAAEYSTVGGRTPLSKGQKGGGSFQRSQLLWTKKETP